MERFHIEGEEFIPEINFDPKKEKLVISGASYHEYTDEFFYPVFAWLEEFMKKSGRKIKMIFNMNYFNTASSKCFFDIFEMLEDYEKEGKGKVEVEWRYQKDDLDMEEAGQDFIDGLDLKIKMVAYD